MSNVSTCQACGKPIRWAKTAAGKNMPLDEKPVTMWLIEDGANECRSVQVRSSHWGNCTDPNRFREEPA